MGRQGLFLSAVRLSTGFIAGIGSVEYYVGYSLDLLNLDRRHAWILFLQEGLSLFHEIVRTRVGFR